jgi:plastocyanin
MNRVESVGFTVPGVYLVICNVCPHFQEGMVAWITVLADDDDDHGHPK